VLEAVRSEVLVALPPGVEPLEPARTGPRRHRWCREQPTDVAQMLAELGLRVTTMGRPPADDTLYFDAAAAAGMLAARLLAGGEPDLVSGVVP
jgi:hypothetical protein